MIVQAKNITKRFGDTLVLSGLSFEVREKESVAICGRSGEGKTTLLHILGTLEAPDAGELAIAGQKVSPLNACSLRNQHIGFIFQAYNLLEDFTALENVLMPARIARQSALRSKGLELLAKVGLAAKADILAKKLSGGERQRVAIARALCNEPQLILADEPTGNLDRANAQKVGELLLSLDCALIVVTHDLELAALCQCRYTLSRAELRME